MTVRPEFARLLTQYLAQGDRSPAWLARRLKVHHSTVTRWLNHFTRPATPELVIRVADLLGAHTPDARQALLAAAGFAYQEGASSDLTPASPAADAELVEPPPYAGSALDQKARSRLPVASTSFVGREGELARIAVRVADPATRLVTIVGLGGIGKSRLAVMAASRLLDQFADRVWFVGLAAVAHASLIPTTIAAALGLPLHGTTEVETHVLRYLRDKQLLLVLDNLEHLLDGVPFFARILALAPGVKILATSRVRLRLDQEWLVSLDGLTVPQPLDDENLPPVENTAVDLFVQRARRLQQDFTFTFETSAEVLRVCRLVGGMPLAIELAAAWLRIVPLAEIAGEIQTNLDFLTTSMQNTSERHQSMVAVFDHSWQLLDERERHTLMCMSVFRGGLTREAAVEVAGADLRILAGLVDGSWIQLSEHGRYEIHELARQYAENKLDAEPSTATDARALHCAYYADLVDRIGDRELPLSERKSWNRLISELDNLWAGWHYATENWNLNQIGKYVPAFGWLGDAHGVYREVVAEFEKFCALARRRLVDGTAPVALHAQITRELAQVLSHLSFLYARAISVDRGVSRGVESIELLRQLGMDGRDGEVSSFYMQALARMSIVAGFHADYERAKLYCDEIMRLTYASNQHPGFYCDAFNTLGQVASLQGKYAEAQEYLMECLARASSDSFRSAAADRLAHVYTDMGNLVDATQLAMAAVKSAEMSGNRSAIGSTLLAEFEVTMALGHFEEAEKLLDRVSMIAEETGNLHVRVRFLNGQARLARCLNRAVEAQQLYQQAYELARGMARNKDAALAQIGVGFALLDQNKFEEAPAYFRAALQAAWERRIMPEVIEATLGLAVLKGYTGQPQIAGLWLRVAIAHPSCSKRIQIEATEILKRIARVEFTDPLNEHDMQTPDTALEGIVLELLR